MTDTALYADVVLAGDDVPRRIRFRESLRADQHRPGASRSSTRSARRARMPMSSATCAAGSDLLKRERASRELELTVRVLDSLPGTIAARFAGRTSPPLAPCGARADSVRRRLSEYAGSEGQSLSRRARRPTRRWDCIGFSPTRPPTAFRWRSSRRQASGRSASTLGELPRPDVEAVDASRRRRGARPGRRRHGPHLQRAWRGALPALRQRRDSPGNGEPAERPLASQRQERPHGHVARAGHADGPRRRRVLQRRARAGRVTCKRLIYPHHEDTRATKTSILGHRATESPRSAVRVATNARRGPAQRRFRHSNTQMSDIMTVLWRVVHHALFSADRGGSLRCRPPASNAR